MRGSGVPLSFSETQTSKYTGARDWTGSAAPASMKIPKISLPLKISVADLKKCTLCFSAKTIDLVKREYNIRDWPHGPPGVGRGKNTVNKLELTERVEKHVG